MQEKEWEGEPDEASFKAYGLECELLRGPFGHWCGYVRVPEGHPFHGIEKEEEIEDKWGFMHQKPVHENSSYIPMFVSLVEALEAGGLEIRPSLDVMIDVHGGVTYAGPAWWSEGDKGWYVGFDCNHCQDIAPAAPEIIEAVKKLVKGPITYKNIDFARNECERLAEQISLALIQA